MEKNEIAQAVGEALDARKAAEVAEAEKVAALKATIKAELEAEQKAKEPAWKGGFATKQLTELGNSNEDNHVYSHYLRTGDIVAAKAALAEGSSSTGGVLVPNDTFETIVQKRNELSFVRAAGAQVFNTSRDTLDIPVEGTATTTFVATTEGSAVDENEPLLESISVPVIKWTKLAKVSNELRRDQASNLEEFLARDFAEKMALTESRYVAVGTGSGQHRGVASTDYGNAGTVQEYNLTSDFISSDIPAILYTLNGQYRQRAAWLMSKESEGLIRSIAASTWFQFSGAQTSASGTGWSIENLLGRPVFNEANMPQSSDATSDAYKLCIVVGDFSRYALVERQGLEVAVDTSVYFATDQTAYRAIFRQGGAPLHAEAFVVGEFRPNA